MIERVDFYSDEEYEFALQLEQTTQEEHDAEQAELAAGMEFGTGWVDQDSWEKTFVVSTPDGMKSVVLTSDYEALKTRCAELEKTNQQWKEHHTEDHMAFGAMRNDLNEIFGDMASAEASLRNSPELKSEWVDIVQAAQRYAAEQAETVDRLITGLLVISEMQRANGPVRAYAHGLLNLVAITGASK